MTTPPTAPGFAAYAALWLWVGLSSAWDLYLTVYYAACLAELNPAGRAIIAAGGIAALVLCKFAGTVVVLGVLAVLWRRPGVAWPVAVALALWQAALVAFLHLA